MNSTHKVEVVPVRLRPHDNADTLSIVDVFGYTVVVRTSDWDGVELGAYLPPDSMVDVTRPEFAFLDNGKGRDRYRIRAVTLRGVRSFGLLIQAPEGAKEGDNLATYFDVGHYEPEVGEGRGHEAEPAPVQLMNLSKYDAEALRRYPSTIAEGEEVMVTEKVHGASGRYCYTDGRMWVGSRTEWKREDKNNIFWQALENTPYLRDWCERHPEFVIYGEIIGQVKGYHYGLNSKRVAVLAFDLLRPDGTWMDAVAYREILGDVPQVPMLYEGPYNFDKVCELADGPSQVPGADHIREGCVVKPLMERWDDQAGRVSLKVVGMGYLQNK